jgi:hypothetical protein
MCDAARPHLQGDPSRPRERSARQRVQDGMQIIGSRLCLLAAGVTLVAGAAFAQAASQAPAPTASVDSAPPEATPGAKPTTPGQNLSRELNQSNGVIHPKEVDPGIQKPAPKTHDLNVVPPPGTSGGAPAPQPK